MNHKQTKKMESGHSMIEMLGVLMIMGLLGITMVVGIRIALNKLKASQIIKDARLSHTMLLTNIQRQEESTDWRDVLFTSNSGKYVQNRFRDEQPQTKVIEVEQAVCEELMGFSEGAKFYTLDAAGLHPLESCAENQDMVIILDMAQGEEVATGCVTKDDCTNGWCNEGTCVTCPEGEAVNEEGTGCTIFCNDDQDVCDDGDNGHTWCCPKEQCTPEYPKCAVTDGKCSWEYSQSDLTATCSWIYQQEDTQAECSITYTQDARLASCSFTITTDISATKQHSSGNNYNGRLSGLVMDQNCPSGSYCYVQFADENCNNNLTDGATGTLYGVCNPLGSVQNICTRKTHVSKPDCPEGRYCVISFTDQSCNANSINVSDSSIGTLYGVCSPLNSNEWRCIRHSGLKETNNSSCPAGQYCVLNYTNKLCGDTNKLQDTSNGELWGTCVPLSSNEARCVRPFKITPESYCPADKYCLLNWKTDTSCNTIGDAYTGTIHGTCIDLNENSGSCPYNQ